MYKDLVINSIVNGMNILQLWVWILKCHICRQCQEIQGIAGQSGSAVGMGLFRFRIIVRYVKASSNTKLSYRSKFKQNTFS